MCVEAAIESVDGNRNLQAAVENPRSQLNGRSFGASCCQSACDVFRSFRTSATIDHKDLMIGRKVLIGPLKISSAGTRLLKN